MHLIRPLDVFSRTEDFKKKINVAKKMLLFTAILFGSITDIVAQSITSFTLIDAENDVEIGVVQDGASLVLADLPSNQLNMNANTSGSIGSVVFKINGVKTQTENVSPYALAGNIGDNYLSWKPQLETYTITATAYSKAKGQGDVLDQESITITFTEKEQEEEEEIVPEVPVNLKGIALGTDRIELTWQDNSDNETDFVLEYRPFNSTNEPWVVLAVLPTNFTAYSDTRSDNNYERFYRLKAKNAIGSSPYTESISVVNFPQPPTNLVVSNVTTKSFKLTWDAAPYGNDYLIERSTQVNGPYEFYDALYFGYTSFDYAGLNPNTTYYFRMRTNLNGMPSDWSETFSVNTLPEDDPDEPEGPKVISFVLVNADSDQDIAQIKEGDTFNLSEIGTSNLNVRAEVGGGTESVVFDYNGQSNFQTENLPVYALGGNTGDDYKAWTPDLGSNTITATAYTQNQGQGLAGDPLTVNFTFINEVEEEPEGPKVTSLVLVNADTDQDISEIKEGDVFNLAEIGTSNLNVRAEVEGETESVIFDYNGQNKFQIDNTAAYALGGNTGGDYAAWNPDLGGNTITAAAYSQDNGEGVAGDPFTINFTFTNEVEPEEPKVTSLVLINADSDQDIAEIKEGDVFNLEEIGTSNLNVRAEVEGGTESVVFAYNGQANFQIDNSPVYALGGNTGSDYGVWNPNLGNNSISATAYTQDNGQGVASVPLTVNFTIINEAEPEEPQGPNVVSFVLVNVESGQDIAVINEGDIFDLAEIGTSNLNVRAEVQVGTESVIFDYNGQNNFQLDNSEPYFIGGIAGNDLILWNPVIGNSAISATAYNQDNGQGLAGDPLIVNFTFINEVEPEEPQGPKVTSFVLVNADSDQDIGQINEGDVFNLAEIGTLNLNVRAEVEEGTESVIFDYNGQSNFQTENLPAYALAGNTGNNYDAWTPDLGSNTITATAYTQDKGQGVAGKPLTVNFTVTNEVEPEEPEDLPAVVRINAGGGAVTFGDTTYIADAYFVGDGEPYENQSISDILNTTQDEIYKTERSSNAAFQTFSYSIPISNGEYQVDLHFAEIYHGATGGGVGGVGQRVFSVSIEGQEVLSDYDINALAGPMTAIIERVNATVSDEELNITFTGLVDEAKLSALSIYGEGSLIEDPGPDPEVDAEGVVSGELRKWHKVTVSFEGPDFSENGAENPFRDYRLNVTFKNGSSTYTVPGYYAADGNAANTSANSGKIWKVHFSPDKIGTWTYEASFRKGNDIAVSTSANAGSAISFNGASGSFEVLNTNKGGRDFRGKGRLEYVGEHYLQFAESGEYFIKAGSDAPENTFAYEDFDATPNKGGRRKSWQPHANDFSISDAGNYTWGNPQGDGARANGRELLGALGYLSNQGMNVFSFLTFSLNGDDGNVYPHAQKTANATDWSNVHHDRFDVSKLEQWEKILEYADKKGIYIHFKTQETENDLRMDGGQLGIERKLYYRELIARFGHHLALNWNLGEENDIWNEIGDPNQNIIKSYAQYIKNVDPYDHHIVIHTYPGQQDEVYDPLLGNNSVLTGPSVQSGINNVHRDVRKWVQDSESAGKKWVVANDEQGGANIGVGVDASYPDNLLPENRNEGDNRKDVRSKVLWGTLMAGGAGVEYYYGYQTGCDDLDCQDHRTRESKWKDAKIALGFFNDYLQTKLTDMKSNDDLTSNTGDYVFAKENDTYVIYLPSGGSTNIDLGNNSNYYTIQWFDPRSGGSLQTGSATGVAASSSANIGNPPSSANQDWVALLTKTTAPNDALKVLVYHETNGFRHGSINAGITMIEGFGADLGWEVTNSQSSSVFTESGFNDYDVVVFLNTSGNALLSAQEQVALENFISNNKGFVGVHAATDTYRDKSWPWYNDLVGAIVQTSPNHTPNNTSGVMDVLTSHPTVDHLGATWSKMEEYYYWELNGGQLYEGNINLLKVRSTGGNSYDAARPITWYKNFGGGRSFYTALGHNSSDYTNNQDFITMIREAIIWAADGVNVANNQLVSSRSVVEDFKLYPNPALDRVNIETEVLENEGTYDLQLFSMDGNMVKAQQIPSGLASVEISDLSPGNYFVLIKGVNFIQQKKLIVIR
jgi:type 1 glutamine amidotransferase